MGARESLQKLADRKESEIRNLQMQLAQAEAYLQAIQDSIKVLPKDSSETSTEPELRQGTLLAQAREVLKAANAPLHINEILKRMNRPVDKSARISLSGSMAAYVRKGIVFKKTGPNIFSLVSSEVKNSRDESDEQLPDSFGSVQ